MSQFDKLIKRITSLDANMRLEELEKVLIAYGYEKRGPRSGSSHYTFRKNGEMPITIPKHTPIKVAYIKKIKALIEREDEHERP